ncbi:MAG: pseudouridine synthase [Thermoguttaceae bacterium]
MKKTSSSNRRSQRASRPGTERPRVSSRKKTSAAPSSRRRRPPRDDDSEAAESTDGIRLQKVLASAGFGSRRACEELIVSGRVEVSRRVVTELGTKVDPATDEIRVDGQTIRRRARLVYLAVNKPRGILCTSRDQQGRSVATQLVPEKYGRLFSVGRLDCASEGLLILTNDGLWAERLAHPRFGVEKVYRVLVAGEVLAADVATMRRGVRLAEQWVRAEHVVIKGRRKMSTILEITLKQGVNREIRRMLARLGHKVMQLQRIAIGPLKLGKMLPGEWRELSRQEVKKLESTSDTVHDDTPPSPRTGRGKKVAVNRGEVRGARDE